MQRRESRKRGASVAPESEKTRRYPVVSTKTGHRPACFLSLLARTSGNVARRDCVLESRFCYFSNTVHAHFAWVQWRDLVWWTSRCTTSR